MMGILALVRKARAVQRSEGWSILRRRLWEYLKVERHYVYLSEFDLQNMPNPPMKTKFLNQDRLDIHFVSSLEQLDKLVTDGFDLNSYHQGISIMKKRIYHGAVAVLCFLDHELVNWVFTATSQHAQKVVDPYPIKVNYDDHEIYIGSAETVVKFRGMGLFPHVTFRMRELYKKNGLKKTLSTIGASNISSLRYHAKTEGVVTGKGRYLRVLWWKFWRETTLPRPVPRCEFIRSLNSRQP